MPCVKLLIALASFTSLAAAQTVVPGITVHNSSSQSSANSFLSSINFESGDVSGPFNSGRTALGSPMAGEMLNGQVVNYSLGAGSAATSSWTWGPNGNYRITADTDSTMTVRGFLGTQPWSYGIYGGAGSTATVEFSIAQPQAVRMMWVFRDLSYRAGWDGRINMNVQRSDGFFALATFSPQNVWVDMILQPGRYTAFAQSSVTNRASSGIGDGQNQTHSGVIIEFVNVVPAPSAAGLVGLSLLAATRRRRA